MMRKFVLFSILILFLATMAAAQDQKFGVGAFGGGNIPIAQEDQKTGSAFGVMARIKVLPFMSIEPNVVLSKWGSPDPIRGIDLGIDGSKVTSYGVEAVLGGIPGKVGFKPLALIGAGIYSIKNDDTEYDESKLGFSLGIGFDIGLSPRFDVSVRGKAMVAPQEEGSKKGAIITGGLIFNLGPVE